MRDLTIEDVEGSAVSAWRVLPEGALLLTLHGAGGEARLVCRCSRSHWILREDPDGLRPSLVAICHGCRTLVRISVAGPAPADVALSASRIRRPRRGSPPS